MCFHRNNVVYCIAFALSIYLVRFLYKTITRYRASKRLNCKEPPSPPQKDRLLGLDFVYQQIVDIQKDRRNASIRELHEKYGPTFSSKFYGSRKIHTVEPQNLQAVMSTDFKSWGVEPLRLFSFDPLIGRGIMGTDGRRWEHSRALLRPAFSRKEISDLPSLEVHVQKLLDKIPRDGSTVNLRPLFTRMALDAASEMLFGESLDMLGNPTPENEAWLQAMNYGQMTLGKRMQLPQWNFFTRDAKFWASCKSVHQFVDAKIEAIARAEKDPTQQRDKHYVLAREVLKETSDPLAIRKELLNVFLPAHEATGVALTNIFFNVARHPHVWNKLRAETLQLPPGQKITYETLKSMEYLQAVISESLRLNPSIGTTSRIALSDTTLPVGGGSQGEAPIYIRKGDIFSVSFYSLHRRKDLFGEDAEQFKPERWVNNHPPRWAYLPFSGGPRVCIGQQMAVTQAAYTIVRFLQTFKDLENRDPVLEFQEQFTLSTQSRNGAKVAFTGALD
ncbi:cytochrome P450 [Periconia macrospinosa]|uniref:Cytochrome P450 n=1 Tax=Periconia macrospinosa TaxID=97972 RepID=A0A2V1D9H2_9PLEO|nr:cytochrome P450 [Periconia macrospinosa]